MSVQHRPFDDFRTAPGPSSNAGRTKFPTIKPSAQRDDATVNCGTRAEPSVDSPFFMARLVRYLSSPPATYHWWPCAAAHATLQGRPASYSVLAPQ